MPSPDTQPSPHIDCFFVQNRLSDFIDQVCPAWFCHSIEVHLRGCADCRTQQQSLLFAKDLVSKLPAPLLEGSMSHVFEKPVAAGPPVFLRPAWIAAEAVIAIALLVSFSFVLPQLRRNTGEWFKGLTSSRATLPPLVAYTPVVQDDDVEHIIFESMEPAVAIQGWDPGSKKVAKAEPPKTEPVVAKAEPPPPAPVVKVEPKAEPVPAIPTPLLAFDPEYKPAPPPEPEAPVVAKKQDAPKPAAKSEASPAPKPVEIAKPTPPPVVKTAPQPLPVPKPPQVVAATPAPRTKTESPAGDATFEFYTFTMTLNETRDSLHTKVMAMLNSASAEKAGKSELGELLNDGLYYHFLIPQGQLMQVRQKLAALGSFKERSKKSPTPVPHGKDRVVLWIGFRK